MNASMGERSAVTKFWCWLVQWVCRICLGLQLESSYCASICVKLRIVIARSGSRGTSTTYILRDKRNGEAVLVVGQDG